MNSIAKIFCPMKQFFSYLGASLAAIAALASCNKEIDAPVEDLKGGVPFEICASTAETKTAIDGAFKTTWVVGETPDSINVYHKLASDAAYTHDGKFLAETEKGKFSGTLTPAPEAGKEYQWLAHYPYDSYLSTPAAGYSYIGSRSDGTQSQKGLNSVAHLCGKYMPLVGKGASVGTATPTIAMKHASSVLEINVANNTEDALDVTSITFTAPESIIGQFVIDYTGNTTTYTEKTYASAVATLSVTDGTIAPGASGKFYIAIKPFTVSSGVLKVAVNGYKKDITISNETVFTAGKIKKINFNYDAVDYVTLPWEEDFSGELGIYSLVSTTSATKTYKENSAGGTSPELLVAKNNGSFSAKVKASAGNYGLTFKSNHADYLSISVDDAAITLNKLSDTEYTLVIPKGVDFFNITFTNTNGSNTRLDDISLKKADTRSPLATPEVIALLNGTTPNSIDVAWGAVDNAGSYEVTATPATGIAVINTVPAVDGAKDYEYTITGLAYQTAYTISVVAKPSDTSLYLDSAAGEAKPVTTGANPASGGEIVTLFSESFGDNENKAREWNDTYKEQGGISSVYSGSTYTITNAKQSKNTMGNTKSALFQSSTGTDAVFEVKSLDVSGYSDLTVSYFWKAGSIKGTYSTSLYYSIDEGKTYTEVKKDSGKGATSFVEVKYTLPAAAVSSKLCLKVVFNTSNAQAHIDDFVLKGIN